MKISIGPIRNVASWEWIGESLAIELARDFEIIKFTNFDSLPKSDVAIVVKKRPTLNFVKGIRTIYCPVDEFSQLNHIKKVKRILSHCKLILSHSRRLIPYFQKYCKTIPIDHHLRFSISHLASYKPDGFTAWAGSVSNLPHIIHYLQENNLPFPVKILTDLNSNFGPIIAKRSNLKYPDLGTSKIGNNSVEIELWTFDRQIKLLKEAKAAIDIKPRTFSQQHKPPTKAQKFICAGVPFAVNKNSESHEYLADFGLCAPHPSDDYLYSRQYYNEVCNLACELRPKLSLARIADIYRKHILSLLDIKFL